jgi:hypothetical protein
LLLTLENAFLLFSLARGLTIGLLLPHYLWLLTPDLRLRHLSLNCTLLFTRLSRRLPENLLLLAKALLRHLLSHLSLCLRLRLWPKLRHLPHLRLASAAAVRIFHFFLLSRRAAAAAVTTSAALTITLSLAVNVLIQTAKEQKAKCQRCDKCS